jgi:anti-sigma B factor antagonist
MPEDFYKVASSQGVNIIELMLPDVLDTAEFDRLNESVMTLLDGKSNERWVLDMTHVQYMGSSVLGYMVNIRQQIKQSQGKLALCGLSPRMAEVFRACSLERLFTITRGRTEALSAVGK